MATLAQNLSKYNLELPQGSTPGGNYVSVNLRGSIAYVAIQFPIWNGQYHYQGRLGQAISTAQGYKAMELCALNVLAQIQSKVGFEKVLGLNHIDAHYQATPAWDDAPKVVDGASDLFVKLLEDKGTHTRGIYGVQHLPRNFCVGLVSSFTLVS